MSGIHKKVGPALKHSAKGKAQNVKLKAEISTKIVMSDFILKLTPFATSNFIFKSVFK